MQVADIDFLRREIHVRRQVQRVNGGEIEIRLPKYNSEPTIHAAQALIDILAGHVALGLTNEWLFEGNAKLPPHQNTVGHRWRMTLSRAGLTGVRLHDLSSLLRVRADRLGLRRGGRPAGARTRQVHDHPDDVRAPVAQCREPGPGRVSAARGRGPRRW